MTVRSITGYGPILEEGKTKVKTLTRERENAAAEVRKQESGLAAAKAVLEAKVIINGRHYQFISGSCKNISTF